MICCLNIMIHQIELYDSMLESYSNKAQITIELYNDDYSCISVLYVFIVNKHTFCTLTGFIIQVNALKV